MQAICTCTSTKHVWNLLHVHGFKANALQWKNPAVHMGCALESKINVRVNSEMCLLLVHRPIFTACFQSLSPSFAYDYVNGVCLRNLHIPIIASYSFISDTIPVHVAVKPARYLSTLMTFRTC